MPSTSPGAAHTVPHCPREAAPLGMGTRYLYLLEFYNKFYVVQRASKWLLIPTRFTSDGTAAQRLGSGVTEMGL